MGQNYAQCKSPYMWKINIEWLIAHSGRQGSIAKKIRRCKKTKKPRSLKFCCSSRDCAIGKVGQKDEMGFRRLVGRAISDSTENTTEIMVIYSGISYL